MSLIEKHEVVTMNLKQEIANIRKENERHEHQSPVVQKLKDAILEAAKQGHTVLYYKDFDPCTDESIHIRRYLKREKLTYSVNREERVIVKPIHYNPDAPDFHDQLRWHGYKTECESRENVIVKFTIFF